MSTRQFWPPSRRQSNSAVSGAPGAAAGLTRTSEAAIGVSRLAGIIELGAFDEHRPRRDLGEDRQRVDAGIEHAEIAVFPDPFLAGMPDAHVFRPFDRHARQPTPGEATPGLLRPGGGIANGWRRRSTRPRAAAWAVRSRISASVGAAGFSSSTCLPASIASRARRWRTLGGVQIATASRSARRRRARRASRRSGRPRRCAPDRLTTPTETESADRRR